jgi:hypothetical protein
MTTPASRALQSRIAAHRSWAATSDRSARTAPARAAADRRFEDQIDPERTLPELERRWRADQARKAHYLAMALKSAEVRRAKAQRSTAAARAQLATATAQQHPAAA